MVTSKQNKTETRRPTVKFFYLVVGRKVGHGRTKVLETRVYNNRIKALNFLNRVELWDKREFVNLYEVDGRTNSGKPEFNATPTLTRIGE